MQVLMFITGEEHKFSANHQDFRPKPRKTITTHIFIDLIVILRGKEKKGQHSAMAINTTSLNNTRWPQVWAGIKSPQFGTNILDELIFLINHPLLPSYLLLLVFMRASKDCVILYRESLGISLRVTLVLVVMSVLDLMFVTDLVSMMLFDRSSCLIFETCPSRLFMSNGLLSISFLRRSHYVRTATSSSLPLLWLS